MSISTTISGPLIQDEGGQMVFDYTESWLNKPGATPLSQSLPLRNDRFKRKTLAGIALYPRRQPIALGLT